MIHEPSVLYVEDDVRSQKVMELALRAKLKLNRITIFSTSDDFLPRVRALKPQPDVIFLDIHMLPISGLQMLEILRQAEPYKRTPVVALTASVMSEEVEMLRRAGFDGCLSKPIDLDTFETSFHSILSGERVWRIT